MSKELPKRNPGPPLGYELFALADRLLPRSVFEAGTRVGCRIATALMPRQKANSRHYLEKAVVDAVQRPDPARHFEVFAGSLLERLRLGRGICPRFCLADAPQAAGFEELGRSDRPALFGTFHIGQSEILGCMLADFGRRAALVRHKVRNARDVETMEAVFGDKMRILWMNNKTDFLLALKEALSEGYSVCLQCDRDEYGGRCEAFEFLGGRRRFPTTIYRLARIMNLPVAFAFAGEPDPGRGTPVHVSTVFEPQGHVDFEEARREHFRETLAVVERLLRSHPCLWFNFGPLHDAAAGGGK